MANNLSCAPACPSPHGRHPSLLREPQVLLQPHHLVSHQTPLALLWAQGGSSLPFAFFGSAEVPFLPTQSRNLPPSGLYLLPSGQVPTRGWRWGWGRNDGPGSRGRRVGEEREDTDVPVPGPPSFPGLCRAGKLPRQRYRGPGTSPPPPLSRRESEIQEMTPGQAKVQLRSSRGQPSKRHLDLKPPSGGSGAAGRSGRGRGWGRGCGRGREGGGAEGRRAPGESGRGGAGASRRRG